jgi:cytochrome c biogenesis protein ResB
MKNPVCASDTVNVIIRVRIALNELWLNNIYIIFYIVNIIHFLINILILCIIDNINCIIK